MKFIFFAVMLIFTVSLRAQICGISGSKLQSYCVDVVDHKHLEVEPGLCLMNQSTAWGVNGELYNLYSTPDSLDSERGMYLRLTYGLWDRLEFGTVVFSDLISSSWGMRYVVFDKGKFGLATIAGANFPIVSNSRNKNLDFSAVDYSFGGGLVTSLQFSDRLSLDMTFEYINAFNEPDWKDNSGQIAYCDLGYYVENGHLQLIGGVGGSRFQNQDMVSTVCTVYYGFTVETEKYILVVSAPNDIYGENVKKSRGVSLALTLTF